MGDPGTHKLIAGNLCLDFINTINGHKSKTANEYINSYQDLIIWSRYYGTISNEKSRTLNEKQTKHSKSALTVLKKTIEFRESLFDIFLSVTKRTSIPKNNLKRIVAIQKEGLAASQLIENNNKFIWTWELNRSLESLLWPIAYATTKLLTSDSLKKVKLCAGVDCDWFFLDKSRNQMRRWCSMEDCGNKFKMRQRYLRQK